MREDPTGSMRNVNINTQRKRATLPQQFSPIACVLKRKNYGRLRHTMRCVWMKCDSAIATALTWLCSALVRHLVTSACLLCHFVTDRLMTLHTPHGGSDHAHPSVRFARPFRAPATELRRCLRTSSETETKTEESQHVYWLRIIYGRSVISTTTANWLTRHIGDRFVTVTDVTSSRSFVHDGGQTSCCRPMRHAYAHVAARASNASLS
jgi:hypothetical protein